MSVPFFREYAGDKKKRFKPVIISHHMLAGLKEGQEKMSKSDPDSAIFMEDTEDDVKRKIKKAYCPPEIVEGNPIMDYANNIIIGYYGSITICPHEVCCTPLGCAYCAVCSSWLPMLLCVINSIIFDRLYHDFCIR